MPKLNIRIQRSLSVTIFQRILNAGSCWLKSLISDPLQSVGGGGEGQSKVLVHSVLTSNSDHGEELKSTFPMQTNILVYSTSLKYTFSFIELPSQVWLQNQKWFMILPDH